MLSPVSVRMATDGIACVHNLMLGSLTAVGGGTGDRYTPYHIRHRTEVAGFMTFLHGDDRFYNNIFIQNYPVEETETVEDMGFKMEDNQEVGTHVFDEYPTYDEWISHFELDKPADMSKLEPYHNKCHLPVWVNGNAYFNGAKACVNEKENLVDNENQVKVELVEKDGHYSIKTNVYEFLKDFRTGIINSDILGYAFEPEQRFEDPDGSTIIFDQDYLGEHRGVAAMPDCLRMELRQRRFCGRRNQNLPVDTKKTGRCAGNGTAPCFGKRKVRMPLQNLLPSAFSRIRFSV